MDLKNRDISKIVETIGINDGEEIYDLKHKIHLLEEENNILIKHLDELKVIKFILFHLTFIKLKVYKRKLS